MPTRVASGAEQEDLGERQRVGMCDGQERGLALHRGKAPGGSAMQLQLRWTATPDDLDVPPQHALRMAGAERFHRRLLGGKPAGKMNGRHPAPLAVSDFAVGEDSSQEPVAVTRDGVGDARDVGGVEAESDDG